MPTRRQQESAERRLQIIAGALEVFSTKGFAQATNKDIAAAAGINSPGLIYHYFKDKADLLRAVAEQFAPPLQLVAHAEEWLILPPVEALTQFGLTYLRLMENPTTTAFLKLSMGEALRNPEFAHLLGVVGPLRVWKLLGDYLRRQMDAGVLRKMDPILAVYCFVGPLIMHIFTQNLLQLPETIAITPESVVAANVETFLRGMQTEASRT